MRVVTGLRESEKPRMEEREREMELCEKPRREKKRKRLAAGEG